MTLSGRCQGATKVKTSEFATRMIETMANAVRVEAPNGNP